MKVVTKIDPGARRAIWPNVSAFASALRKLRGHIRARPPVFFADDFLTDLIYKNVRLRIDCTCNARHNATLTAVCSGAAVCDLPIQYRL
jgi:hypothetical protein